MGQFVQKYARAQNLHILIFMPATPHSVSQCYEHCQSLWTEYTCVHDRPFSFHPRKKKKSIILKVIFLENTLIRGNLIFTPRRCQNKSFLFLLCFSNRTFTLKCHLTFLNQKMARENQVVLLF